MPLLIAVFVELYEGGPKNQKLADVSSNWERKGLLNYQFARIQRQMVQSKPAIPICTSTRKKQKGSGWAIGQCVRSGRHT